MIKPLGLRFAERMARTEEGRITLKMLGGNPRGKRLLGRFKRRWEDNIRMDLIELCINARNWVDSAQNRDH